MPRKPKIDADMALSKLSELVDMYRSKLRNRVLPEDLVHDLVRDFHLEFVRGLVATWGRIDLGEKGEDEDAL